MTSAHVASCVGGVALLDRDIEQRRIARPRDDTAPDPVVVGEDDLRVQHCPAEQQRRVDGRVQGLLPAETRYNLAAETWHEPRRRNSALGSLRLLRAPAGERIRGSQVAPRAVACRNRY